MTDPNGNPGCFRDRVERLPMRPRYIRVRVRSANVGSGTGGWSVAGPGPACFLVGEEGIVSVSWVAEPELRGPGNSHWGNRVDCCGLVSSSFIVPWSGLREGREGRLTQRDFGRNRGRIKPTGRRPVDSSLVWRSNSRISA